jgi:hypothetical protein
LPWAMLFQPFRLKINTTLPENQYVSFYGALSITLNPTPDGFQTSPYPIGPDTLFIQLNAADPPRT